jgi:hypothetical protein
VTVLDSTSVVDNVSVDTDTVVINCGDVTVFVIGLISLVTVCMKVIEDNTVTLFGLIWVVVDVLTAVVVITEVIVMELVTV